MKLPNQVMLESVVFLMRYWRSPFKDEFSGNSLVVQWLGLRAFTAEGLGSIPGRGTKIPQASKCGKKIIKIK